MGHGIGKDEIPGASCFANAKRRMTEAAAIFFVPAGQLIADSKVQLAVWERNGGRKEAEG